MSYNLDSMHALENVSPIEQKKNRESAFGRSVHNFVALQDLRDLA